ncbi:MAG: tRNA epoxyqueuosine(34) reductase QueG [Bdellovibrionota bacterium]
MSESVKERIRTKALELGASHIGFSQANPIQDHEKLLRWLSKGHAQNMSYMSEPGRVEKRHDPKKLWPAVQSILCASFSYKPKIDEHASPLKFGRYAWGEDYHLFVKRRLFDLLSWMQSSLDASIQGRVFVDTAPVLERSLARQAGLGWIGKNTCLMSQQHGSYLYLGEIFLSHPFAPDRPVTDHCGTCTACLDACPTQAFEGPYQLDSEKCISYQTLENRDQDLPSWMKGNTQDWIAGCDICQEVCPWNHKAPASTLPEIAPKPFVALHASDFQTMTSEEFDQQFSGTTLLRTGLEKMKKNLPS